MRTRTVVIIILLTLGAFSVPASWAQPVQPAPRPAVATAPRPVVAATPSPVAVPAAIAPVADVPQVTPPAIVEPTPPPPPQPPKPAQAPRATVAPEAPQPPKPATAPRVATAPEAAPALAPARFSNMNVRIEVIITDQTGSSAPTKKMVSLTVSDGGRGSVRSGVTVPIPSTTFAPPKDSVMNPMTSYSYRDMGLSLDVTGATIQDNFVRLRLAVEYNPVDEKMASSEGPTASMLAQGPASFARFSQTLELVLENGKPLVVAQSSDPVPSRNRTASLEVKATILK